MHYRRLHLNGTLGLVVRTPPPLLQHTGGYLLAYEPGHPLTTPGQRSRVYEHRKVFYDAHGEGPFACHVCGASVTWAEMHVDHLNDNPGDNRLDNLAPACPTCNQWRGKRKMVMTRRKQGRQVTAFGQTKCVAEWAAEIGITPQSLFARLADGWSPERAVSEPRGKFGPRRKTAA